MIFSSYAISAEDLFSVFFFSAVVELSSLVLRNVWPASERTEIMISLKHKGCCKVIVAAFAWSVITHSPWFPALPCCCCCPRTLSARSPQELLSPRNTDIKIQPFNLFNISYSSPLRFFCKNLSFSINLFINLYIVVSRPSSLPVVLLT